MSETVSLKHIHRVSLPAAKQLLSSFNLPTDDLTENLLEHFIGVSENNELIALAGIEIQERFALLRSVVVKESHRSLGLAKQLTLKLEENARKNQLKAMYLITTTASDYFPKLGYQVVEREDVPDAIKRSKEFSSLCPASAKVMMKELVS